MAPLGKYRNPPKDDHFPKWNIPTQTPRNKQRAYRPCFGVQLERKVLKWQDNWPIFDASAAIKATR